jgi:hypothetical protein
MVLLADQQSAWTDNGEPIVCILKTGTVGNPYVKTQIKHISAKFGVLRKSTAKVRIAVFQNGSDMEPPNVQQNASLGMTAIIGEAAGSYNRPQVMTDFVQVDFVPVYDNKSIGLEQVIEYRYTDGEGFEFRGHIVEYEEK